MFNKLRLYMIRRKAAKVRKFQPYKKINPPKVIKRTTLKKRIVDSTLICCWTTAIVLAPSSVIVGALSISLVSAGVRRLFKMKPGLTTDLIHPILDIGAFALATSAWLWAREFILFATVIGIPKVTSEIEERYNNY